MANNLKELMKLSEPELVALGIQHGFNFAGASKATMAKAIEQSAASGWMDVHKELMDESPDEEYDHSVGFHGDSSQLSDSAHIAQMLHSAGFTETFHNIMGSGSPEEVLAINKRLAEFGANVDDVWKHLPKHDELSPAIPFKYLASYMQSTLTDSQDIMPKLEGHHESNFMDEYSTNKGGIQASYEHLAHMYLDKSSYIHELAYEKDVRDVAARLASQLGPKFHEVAFAAGQNIHNSGSSNYKISYMDVLPQIGDPSVVGNSLHPREALNEAGLPLGSYGSAVGNRGAYSLTASLTGQPSNSELSKGMYSEIADTVRSLANVYKGSTGMNARPLPEQSDYERLMDPASRYMDMSDARSAFNNLDEEVRNTTSHALRVMEKNNWDAMEADSTIPNLKVPKVSKYLRQTKSQTPVSDYTPMGMWSMGVDTDNARREMHEQIMIANLDSAYSVGEEDTVPVTARSTVQYHDEIEQGTPEWHNFRNQYDITGSTAGAYLGNDQYTNPIKQIGEKIGLTSRPVTPRQQRNFERGHRLEAEARTRVAHEIGQDITQVGAITNSEYPGMMYSPDGLIGDDALWEHKAPNDFKSLSDTPNYMDQMQLGMLLSGRDRTLFTQTVGDESRSQWVERDPDWYSRNRNKLDSVLARAKVGRQYMEDHQDMDEKELIRNTRKAMTGEGIWGFRTSRNNNEYYTEGRGGMSRYSANAGTESDEFLAQRPSSNYEASAPTTPPAEDSNEANSKMALAVKAGVLGAQEDNEQKGKLANGLPARPEDQHPGMERQSADEFFDSMMRRTQYGAGYSGGGSGSGGGGGRGNGPDGREPDPMDALARGVAGGSVSSALGGVQSAMNMTPWGRVANVAIGAVQIGDELADTANESLGRAQEAGMVNPVAYASQTQGMEMLGLSESQAANVAATTHDAYNRMTVGDPSAATRMTVATRGLITLQDFWDTKGDTVALTRLIQERGRARGMSQAQIAGLMSMAGLSPLARTYQREEQMAGAEAVRDAGASTDTLDATDATARLQAERRRVSPTYAVQSQYFQSGSGVANTAADAIEEARAGVNTVSGMASSGLNSALAFIKNEESSGNMTAQSKTSSAFGSMQVLSGTRKDPGFDVIPARDNSPEEAERVGRDYYQAMLKRYNGDSDKAMAAYTDGPGTVDDAVKQYGTDWLSAMPQQAKTRVANWHREQQKLQTMSEGADGFTRNGVSYGQTPSSPTVIQVNIDAKVNSQQATASVAATGGQTTAKTVNVNQGANQRR